MIDRDARTAVTLVLSPDESETWPAFSELAGLRDDGLVTVDISDDIDFVDVHRTLEAARFTCLLRDCTALGLPVLWGGRGDAATVQRLGHLLPPARPLRGAPPGPLEHWRSSFRPGSFTWRRGAGFVTIDDRRLGRPRRIVIGDPCLLAAFEQLAGPVLRDYGPVPNNAAVAHLAAHDLTIDVGPWLLRAPCRARP
jgi:hypothetical protein